MQRLQANDFEIGFLDGWRDGSQIVLIGPERPIFTPNVQVHREPAPADGDVHEYFAAQRAELARLEGFRLNEHGDRMLGGQSALQHDYSWLLPDHPGLLVRQLQLVTVRAGTVFTLTCSALEQDWELAHPAFEMTIAGFRWR